MDAVMVRTLDDVNCLSLSQCSSHRGSVVKAHDYHRGRVESCLWLVWVSGGVRKDMRTKSLPCTTWACPSLH